MADSLEMRLATLDGLPSITELIIQAFETDPEWGCRYPLRHEYPEDHFECIQEPFRQTLESGRGRKDAAHVMFVVTLKAGDSSKLDKPIAVAVWEHQPSNGTEPETAMFNQVIDGAKKERFDEKYGSTQIHLEIIATHPDFQDRGTGTKLMGWGLETAAREKRVITLFASPEAAGFYTHLGFDTLFNLTIRVEGESEKVEAVGMELKKPRDI